MEFRSSERAPLRSRGQGAIGYRAWSISVCRGMLVKLLNQPHQRSKLDLLVLVLDAEFDVISFISK